MLTLQISKTDVERLRYERYANPCVLVQKRLHVLYLKSTMKLTHGEIAKIVDVSANSVTNYIRSWNEGGYEQICTVKYKKPKSVLCAHEGTLVSYLTNHPPHTITEAVSKIEKLTGVKRKASAVRSWLKKQGFRYRKTGQIPAKADKEKQADFLENELNPLIAQAKAGDGHLLFMDAVHCVMGVFLAHVWSKLRVLVKSSSGRKRYNILGVVNALTKQIDFISNDTYINAESVVKLLKKLRTIYTDDKPIYIVLDNARYQKCKLVKGIAEQLSIQLVYLPPYSPNLNITERLWKWLKKKCLAATFYDNFTDFKNAIEQTLEKGNSVFKEELKSLLSLKFQTF